MKLLLDEHYAAVIAETLRQRGHDVVALQDSDMTHLRGSTDEQVFDVAQRTGRVLVTENIAHFRSLADRCYRTGDAHAGLLYTTNTAFPRHRHDAFVSAIVAALEAWLKGHGKTPVLEEFLEVGP
ncbi:hypothetical protein BH23ACT9_BH23ACT9_20080 [soil metagenome]